MLDVSIIIVNYNTNKLIMESIRSVVEDKSKASREIIIIDNASSDGSLPTLENLKGKVQNYSLIVNNQNLGFAKANNQGLAIAKGKYKLLLNSDARLITGTLDTLINFANDRENLGMVAPKLRNIDGSTQGSVFRFPTVFRAISQYWLFNKGILDKYAPDARDPIKVEAVVMACAIITQLAINKVGYLDERYFMYFEDIDYCRKLKKVGLDIYYLPACEVVHVHGASGDYNSLYGSEWKQLIPSSILYHGKLKHYLINFIIWSGQKLQKIFY